MLAGIKLHLPWWAKIGAKLVLSRTPMVYRLWQRIGLFRHGQMDTADYALGIFDAHVSKASLGKLKLQGKTILEIGPGDSIATAIIAYAYGAKALLMDAGPFARDDVSAYRPLCDQLASEGLPVPDLSSARSIDDLLRACHGEYWTQGLSSWSSIPDDSVDFVFSQAVLEHIRKHEFLPLQRECYRVMKPRAVATHRVDLRDHLGGALNNLRFSESRWESDFFSRSGFYTNRIQMNEMLAMFASAGFDVDVLDVRRWEALPTPRRKMDSAFADLPEEELNVSGFNVLFRRK
ncbi:MAG: methyltransferase domain-containing protein [Methylomicrobium sp.]|nr:methyltransferase domain-containing protein [Methylomicrobium sp.]